MIQLKQKLILQKILFIIIVFPIIVLGQQNDTQIEPHRPYIHFTPQKGWMNDPNGMVYYNGTYHLFFQHNPDSTVWGPMHWGHAVSRDLIHWEEKEIALYPDNLGTIFSGSAVIDKENTAGFGKDAMVAIYTNHSHELEDKGVDTFQTQSIAYSLDQGRSWTKYAGNPVLRNPGIRDFRDPKVFWFEPLNQWIMSLAVADHIEFYSSPDLKSWVKESEFGKAIGAHGGVWECPDLISFDVEGKKVWILIVNINPGGPNGGSATQYFVGDFDGHSFHPRDTEIRWLDYGPDEYAGVTWSNTGSEKIFLGWMSNWSYANVVPTERWRSAMTVPRKLTIRSINGDYILRSEPVKNIDNASKVVFKSSQVNQSSIPIVTENKVSKNAYKLDISLKDASNFSVVLSNEMGEQTVIGFDAPAHQYYIDRTRSGKVSFEKGFAGRFTAPRFIEKGKIDLTLIIDRASVEVFADGGLTTMTSIFFPTQDYNNISIETPKNKLKGKVLLKEIIP